MIYCSCLSRPEVWKWIVLPMFLIQKFEACCLSTEPTSLLCQHPKTRSTSNKTRR